MAFVSFFILAHYFSFAIAMSFQILKQNWFKNFGFYFLARAAATLDGASWYFLNSMV